MWIKVEPFRMYKFWSAEFKRRTIIRMKRTRVRIKYIQKYDKQNLNRKEHNN